MKTGKMVFASWMEFTDELELIFCPENEVTTALMTLESDQYLQRKRNVDAYTDEFRELIALSGDTDPIACGVWHRSTKGQRSPGLVSGRTSI
jgi:hypothetical protein